RAAGAGAAATRPAWRTWDGPTPERRRSPTPRARPGSGSSNLSPQRFRADGYWYFLPTAAASCWDRCRAWSTVAVPAIAAAICCDTWVPSSSNSGMSTYWTPVYGTGCTVGWFTSALAIESRVICAKPPATAWYWDSAYV